MFHSGNAKNNIHLSQETGHYHFTLGYQYTAAGYSEITQLIDANEQCNPTP